MCTQSFKKQNLKAEFKEALNSLNKTVTDAQKWISDIAIEKKYKKNLKQKNNETTIKKNP